MLAPIRVCNCIAQAECSACGAGSFTSARAATSGSEAGRPSDKDEVFSDAAARDDSFASAASFGQASAVSAKSFQSAQSGARVRQNPQSSLPSLIFLTGAPLPLLATCAGQPRSSDREHVSGAAVTSLRLFITWYRVCICSIASGIDIKASCCFCNPLEVLVCSQGSLPALAAASVKSKCPLHSSK